MNNLSSPNFCPYCGGKLETKHVDGRDRLYCSSRDRVIWRNPVPAVGVVVSDGSEVLLIKRGIEPWKGKWSIPAGFMELDDSPRNAAVRELEEETGLEVEQGDLELLENVFFAHPDKEYVFVAVYSVERDSTSGEIRAGDDAEEACFWALEDLENNREKVRNPYLELIETHLNA